MMKIIRVIGGLGNQMFQYALYLKIKEIYPSEDVYIDITHFSDYKLHNGFEIERVFNLKPKVADFSLVRKYSRIYKSYKFSRLIRKVLSPKRSEYIEHSEYCFDKQVLASERNYFEGYWQNESYFSDIRELLLDKFSFTSIRQRNIDLLDSNNDKILISVHIRRGDYLKAPLFKNICEIDYYQRAISFFEQKRTNLLFLVFSNDISWCKENLKSLDGTNSLFVDWNQGENSYQDMYLMSKCQHNIIANSSFSWWGAWLNQNPNKIVISPNKWANLPNSEQIIPNKWIKL